MRIALLLSLGLLDSKAEPVFDRITRMASTLLDAPIALVSLIDEDRQWFKSRVGVNATETPRDIAFCAHALLQDSPLIVPDATQDRRFTDNPLVTGEPSIRFYAGAQLRSIGGTALGTLCIIDRRARDFSAQQAALLSDLAAMASHEIAHRELAMQCRSAQNFCVELGPNRCPVIRHASERLAALVHSTPQALQRDAQVFLQAVHLEDRKALLAALRLAEASDTKRLCEFRLQSTRQPTPRWFEAYGSVRRLAGGRTLATGYLVDISERKLIDERMVHLACHDDLTGLDNRTYFLERVASATAAAREGVQTEQAKPAVLLVDLDNFKTVNDSIGHGGGDQLLILVAQRLRHAVREHDYVARLGGDEFAVLLRRVQDVREAAGIAKRIVQVMEPPFTINGHAFSVSASVGVALQHTHEDGQELLRNADLAMYQAKRQGRGRFALFEPQLHAALLQRVTLEEELRHTLQTQHGLVLHYQPIVELATGRLIGAEALVRWQHPQRGLLSPGSFIPLAEESGLIVPLGCWVLKLACREAAGWQYSAEKPFTITVNVSTRQVQDPSLVNAVCQALSDSGLPASALVLEITESVFMHSHSLMLQRLQEIKALGVSIAMDDFGTGFSSLAYLQRFPIDVLKIDKSFVGPVTQGSREAALVQAVVALAEALGLRCIGEGIERTAQQQVLQQLGCRFGQGFLFAKPMPAQALEKLLLHPA